jgi:hypothetical protein
MKKCKECGNEFTPTNNRGSEQLYCSSSCRNKAAIKRHNLKIQHNGKQSNIHETGHFGNKEIHEVNEKYLSGINQRNLDSGTYNGGSVTTLDGNFIAALKETYDARVNETFYKLKCENLEAEAQKLRQEIVQLELEIAELEEEEEQDQGGMISGIMEQFKTDPVNTINFTTELLNNLFKKSKPDEQKKSS